MTEAIQLPHWMDAKQQRDYVRTLIYKTVFQHDATLWCIVYIPQLPVIVIDGNHERQMLLVEFVHLRGHRVWINDNLIKQYKRG